MENQTQPIVVTCPECKKKMRMRNPQKAGTYKVTCPFCGKPFPIKMVDDSTIEPPIVAPEPIAPVSVPKTEPEPTPAPAPEPKPTPAPQPAEDEGPVVIQHCTGCGMKLRIRNPKPGQHTIRCPKCQSLQQYTYTPAGTAAQQPEPQKPNKTKPVAKNVNLSRGCLVQQRGLFRSNITHQLAGKETIIGRLCNDSPSDVMVNDDTMSRRSVSIVGESKPAGIVYKLTVINATNRVLLNGKTLSVGTSVYINFGDTIVLGRTTFKFEKVTDGNA